MLLSGGLDSTTALYESLTRGTVARCLFADYGQRQVAEEMVAARAIARDRGIGLTCVTLPTSGTSAASALTNRAVDMPRGRTRAQIAADTSPATYVPARNTMFLAVALAHVEVTGADTIVVGANADDAAGYPDCRLEYFVAWEHLAEAALGRPVSIDTPLLDYTKPQIVTFARGLGVPIEETWSCYDPQFVALGHLRAPCGVCDACVLRSDALTS